MDNHLPSHSANSSPLLSTGQKQPLSKAQRWLSKPQKFLGVTGLIAFLTLANILVPFSVDIYTPALPQLPKYFATSESVVNLTLFGFYLSFALALFVFGSLSDKTGRKPILVSGNLIYFVTSIICAWSPSIEILIAARVVQALGAGAVCAIATALVSDCFVPAKRATIFTVMQILFVLGPIVAPLLGGVILLVGTWREVFLVLAILGFICLLVSFFYTETLEESSRTKQKLLRSLMGAIRAGDNRHFLLILGVMSLFNFFFMAYISAGAYIYVDHFGLTQQHFTYFFAISAALAAIGPMMFQRFNRKINLNAFTIFTIIFTAVIGIIMALWADKSLWLFAALTVLICMSTMTVRPYTIDMMLALNPQRVGSASSLLNFVSTIFGSLGMVAVMLFDNLVLGLGTIVTLAMILSLPLWLLHSRLEQK